MSDNKPVSPRCTAHSRRTGEPCRQPAMHGRAVCRLHGGKTPRGIASPHWRGRGYSKDMPTRLADRYRIAMEDPGLLSVRSEVALLDARLGELAATLPDEPAELDSAAWHDLLALIEQRRKLVDTERRREEVLQLSMTATQALTFVSTLMTAVVECVADQRERQALALRFEHLLSRSDAALQEIVVE